MADLTWLDNLINQNQPQRQGGYGAQVSPVVTPSNPSGIGTGGTVAPPNGVAGADMAQVFAALAQHIMQQGQLGQDRLQQGNDLLFGRHLGTDGQPIRENSSGSSGNPWATSSWETPQERYDHMQNRTGLAYGPGDVQSTIRTRQEMQANGVQPPQIGQIAPDLTLPPMSQQELRGTEERYAPRVKNAGYPFGLPMPVKGKVRSAAEPQRKNRYSIL